MYQNWSMYKNQNPSSCSPAWFQCRNNNNNNKNSSSYNERWCKHLKNKGQFSNIEFKEPEQGFSILVKSAHHSLFNYFPHYVFHKYITASSNTVSHWTVVSLGKTLAHLVYECGVWVSVLDKRPFAQGSCGYKSYLQHHMWSEWIYCCNAQCKSMPYYYHLQGHYYYH